MSEGTNNLELPLRVRGGVLAVAGVASVVLAGFFAADTRQFIARAQYAEAEVVSLYAGAAHPKLEFSVPEGKKVEFAGSGWISHRVGDRVPVLFAQDGTAIDARVDEPGSLWFLTIMFGALGTAATLAGSFVLLRRA